MCGHECLNASLVPVDAFLFQHFHAMSQSLSSRAAQKAAKLAAQKEAKQKRDRFRRRKNATIKKSHELALDFGAEVYTWIYMNGRSFIYKSSPDPQCPPSFKKLMVNSAFLFPTSASC